MFIHFFLDTPVMWNSLSPRLVHLIFREIRQFRVLGWNLQQYILSLLALVLHSWATQKSSENALPLKSDTDQWENYPPPSCPLPIQCESPPFFQYAHMYFQFANFCSGARGPKQPAPPQVRSSQHRGEVLLVLSRTSLVFLAGISHYWFRLSLQPTITGCKRV